MFSNNPYAMSSAALAAILIVGVALVKFMVLRRLESRIAELEKEKAALHKHILDLQDESLKQEIRIKELESGDRLELSAGRY